MKHGSAHMHVYTSACALCAVVCLQGAVLMLLGVTLAAVNAFLIARGVGRPLAQKVSLYAYACTIFSLLLTGSM